MKKFLIPFIVAFFITGCSSLSLSTDYDKKIDFSTLKTYRWHNKNEHNASSLKYLTPIMDQRIRTTIDQQLQQQNYRLTSTGDVDYLVNYSVVINDRTDIRTYNNYNGYYPGYRYGAYGRGMAFGYNSGTDTQITHYKQGTLIIDIINPETDQLIWRGAADGRLPETSDREKRDTLTKEYVVKILSAFPPKD